MARIHWRDIDWNDLAERAVDGLTRMAGAAERLASALEKIAEYERQKNL